MHLVCYLPGLLYSLRAHGIIVLKYPAKKTGNTLNIAIQVCAVVQGIVFKPFRLEQGIENTLI